MDLGDDPYAILLQALHHPELPQGPGAIEGRTGDLARHLAELPASTGGGAADAPDVVVDVEVGIVHPNRMVEVQRNLHQPSTKRRNQVEAVGDELLDLLERVAARHGVGIEHHGHGHVHVVGGGLEVQKRGVEPGESFHVASDPRVVRAGRFCQPGLPRGVGHVNHEVRPLVRAY